MDLLLLLLSSAAALLGALYLLGAFRQRRAGEPPLDKGPLPWFGNVLPFRGNTLKFLEKMKEKHGDVFTTQLGGFYYTFLQDPLSFGAFTKESRDKLDFRDFARQLVLRAFGYVTMKEDHQILHLSSNKHLKGGGLVGLTQAMMSNLQNVMLHKLDSAADRSSWTEDGLFMYSYNVVFRAGYLALFGNCSPQSSGGAESAREMDRAESQNLFYEFRKYDQLFPNLMYGILSPKLWRESKKLKAFFWKVLAVPKIQAKDDVSGWVGDMQRHKQEQGMEEFMIDRFMLTLLWVSQGNTGPSCFWLLLFLMKHPDAMAAARKEVDRVLSESGQKVQPSGPPVDLTSEMLTRTPIMDSIVEETLRLTAAPLLVRAVKTDMTFKMADGRQYSLRKGDRMAVFPYSALHMNPEIHEDPQSFKYDRFLNPDGTRKTDFSRGGVKVKYPTMPWGGGVAMCPGRFFATNELKQFIFLMLVYFEFELKDPEEEIPQIDYRRWGFGTMQPIRDVQFRYRLRF